MYIAHRIYKFFLNFLPDMIDIVKDQLHGTDYVREEDPTWYISHKTRRGPLSENWLEEYWNDVKVKIFFSLFTNKTTWQNIFNEIS